MWPIDRPPQWVDRSQELATLRAGVEALRHGEGAAIWVEGEPGIGKSSLVVEALAGASELGWDIGWGIADQLTERLPLSVIQDCLQVRLSSPDPRRAHAAGRLRPYGIRRGVRGPRPPRAASGWAALTPTEVKIAALVARGDSTSEIARGMFLSRRTVQTYISHILAKLGAKSRVEIVREALGHGVSP
jgi:DNA-binding CsgD family transcriptional regulator